MESYLRAVSLSKLRADGVQVILSGACDKLMWQTVHVLHADGDVGDLQSTRHPWMKDHKPWIDCGSAQVGSRIEWLRVLPLQGMSLKDQGPVVDRT